MTLLVFIPSPAGFIMADKDSLMMTAPAPIKTCAPSRTNKRKRASGGTGKAANQLKTDTAGGSCLSPATPKLDALLSSPRQASALWMGSYNMYVHACT